MISAVDVQSVVVAIAFCTRLGFVVIWRFLGLLKKQNGSSAWLLTEWFTNYPELFAGNDKSITTQLQYVQQCVRATILNTLSSTQAEVIECNIWYAWGLGTRRRGGMDAGNPHGGDAVDVAD